MILFLKIQQYTWDPFGIIKNLQMVLQDFLGSCRESYRILQDPIGSWEDPVGSWEDPVGSWEDPGRIL